MTMLDTEVDTVVCRHCGEPITTDDEGDAWLDENGDDGCSMSDRHEAI